mgnify:CR=1 FL=1
MKEELSIDIIGLVGACSYALDCIEAEFVNIKNKHGKRVAYISIRMAEYWKIQGDELQDLAMCALLHDNALTQYISEELKKDSVINCKKDLSEKKTNLHCIYGEKNPIKFLNLVSQDKLDSIIENKEFLKQYDEIYTNFKNYMESRNTWFTKKYPNNQKDLIAYFSAEYGLDEILPIYSGGLGILSGFSFKISDVFWAK